MITYEFQNDDHIFYSTGNIFKHMASISKAEFAWWMKREGRLEYMVDSSDERGEHRQYRWNIEFDEYLLNCLCDDISKDLTDYLKQLKQTA